MLKNTFIFCLTFSNIFLYSQSMYLDSNESMRAYSIVGNYTVNSNLSDEYITSLGFSAVLKGNHEFEYIYNNYSSHNNNFNINYKYFIKLGSFFNIFFGLNNLYEDSINDDPENSYTYGWFGKFSDQNLIFFPFIYRTEFYDSEISYYDAIGISILFYDISLQPEYIKYDNGDSFYRMKFYLWEFE